MRKVALASSLLLMLAACNSTTIPVVTEESSPQPALTDAPLPTDMLSPLPESGIEGTVLIGPTCPVQREGDTSCDDQPFQATITVLEQDGSEVTRFQSDAQGQFRVMLQPGIYTLRPEKSDPDVPLPFAGEMVVTVTAGRFTPVVIMYDSGIR